MDEKSYVTFSWSNRHVQKQNVGPPKCEQFKRTETNSHFWELKETNTVIVTWTFLSWSVYQWCTGQLIFTKSGGKMLRSSDDTNDRQMFLCDPSPGPSLCQQHPRLFTSSKSASVHGRWCTTSIPGMKWAGSTAWNKGQAVALGESCHPVALTVTKKMFYKMPPGDNTPDYQVS